MATLAHELVVSVEYTREEAHAQFERACKRYLNISSEEFISKWKSGQFNSDPELAYKAADVALLLPLLSV